MAPTLKSKQFAHRFFRRKTSVSAKITDLIQEELLKTDPSADIVFPSYRHQEHLFGSAASTDPPDRPPIVPLPPNPTDLSQYFVSHNETIEQTPEDHRAALRKRQLAYREELDTQMQLVRQIRAAESQQRASEVYDGGLFKRLGRNLFEPKDLSPSAAPSSAPSTDPARQARAPSPRFHTLTAALVSNDPGLDWELKDRAARQQRIRQWCNDLTVQIANKEKHRRDDLAADKAARFTASLPLHGDFHAAAAMPGKTPLHGHAADAGADAPMTRSPFSVRHPPFALDNDVDPFRDLSIRTPRIQAAMSWKPSPIVLDSHRPVPVPAAPNMFASAMSPNPPLRDRTVPDQPLDTIDDMLLDFLNRPIELKS